MIGGAHLTIRELASIRLPSGARDGVLVMLKAYFDDSGSYPGSDLVVIGGLIGTVDQWSVFEPAWDQKLMSPLPGKDPLGMFHLSVCRALREEFFTYTRAESDALTHDFRRIIIDSGVVTLANGIDQKAWNEIVVGHHRDVLGSAIDGCFVAIVDNTLNYVANFHPDKQIAFFFDQGIESDRLSVVDGRAPLINRLFGFWG